MDISPAGRAYIYAAITTLVTTCLCSICMALDVPGFVSVRTAYLLTKNGVSLSNVDDVLLEIRATSWTSAVLAAAIALTAIFLFRLLALPPLHNGQLNGISLKLQTRETIATAMRAVACTGVAFAVERALDALLLAPELLLIKNEEGVYIFPSQSDAEALYRTYGTDAVGALDGRSLGIPVFVQLVSLDMCFAPLLFVALNASAIAPTAEKLKSLVIRVMSLLVVGYIGMVGGKFSTSIFVSGAFYLTAVLCAGTYVVVTITVLSRARRLEADRAESSRVVCMTKFDSESRWVEQTTRTRVLSFLPVSFLAVAVFQLAQIVLIFVNVPSPHVRLLSIIVDTCNLISRASLAPTFFYIVLILCRATAEEHFQGLATRHEEKTRHAAQKLIIRYVCHEVRVPLNSLSLGIELIADALGLHVPSTSPSPGFARIDTSSILEHQGPQPQVMSGERLTEMQDILVHMSTGTATMGRILNDVLQLHALEQGRMPLVRDPFPVTQLVTRVEHVFAAQAAQKGVALSVTVDPTGLPGSTMVFGDVDRLLQVCNNLVSNAIKFTPSGKRVMVNVCVSAVADSRNEFEKATPQSTPAQGDVKLSGQVARVLYSVEDEGVGIDDEDKGKLFKPFHQLKSGARFKQHSTGLGLSICRGIVHEHGGSIELESKGRGEGSRFWFTVLLPIVLSSTARADDAASENGVSPMTTPRNSLLPAPAAVVPATLPLSIPVKPRQRIPTSLDVEGSTRSSDDGLSPKAVLRPIRGPSSQALGGSCNRTCAGGMAAPATRLSPDPCISKRQSQEPARALRAQVYLPSEERAGSVSLPASSGGGTGAKPFERPTPTGVSCVVVDDVAGNRLLLQRILQRMGYTVAVASNGKEGAEVVGRLLESASGRVFVLMDGNMPVMNGMDATRAILSSQDARRVTVFGVTGNAHEEDRAEFLRAGATQVLPKPVSRNELAAVFARYGGKAGDD